MGTRPSSSQSVQFYSSLSPNRTSNSNNNVLKTGIIQKMLSIKSNFSYKFSIDKIESDVMCVAVSVQACVEFDHTSNELRSSPSNFISKINRLIHCEYIADELIIDGLEELGTGKIITRCALTTSRLSQVHLSSINKDLMDMQ